MIPPLRFVGSRHLMGEFVLGRSAKIGSWNLALLILDLNVSLILQCWPNTNRTMGVTTERQPFGSLTNVWTTPPKSRQFGASKGAKVSIGSSSDAGSIGLSR